MSVLLLGSSGQVGQALRSALTGGMGGMGGMGGAGGAGGVSGAYETQALGPWSALGPWTALDRQKLDLGDAAAIRAAVRHFAPTLVVNAAAYTAVDRAESERDAAWAVNARAVEVLARACRDQACALIHFSTDYVFDGSQSRPYRESDPTAPLNVYGASKRAGEEALLASGVAGLVLRTTWVYGRHGNNFLKTMLRLACQRTGLRVVADQRGAPTAAERLAETVLALAGAAAQSGDKRGPPGCASRSRSGPSAPPDPQQAVFWFAERAGLYHLSATGETTWHDYACRVIATAAQLPEIAPYLQLGPAQIEAIASEDYPTPAARPRNSLLNCSRFEERFGLRLPHWQADVEACVREIASEVASEVRT